MKLKMLNHFWEIIRSLIYDGKIRILCYEIDIYLKYVIYTKIIFPHIFLFFLSRNLYVFHKPHTYAYNYEKMNFKVYDCIDFYVVFLSMPKSSIIR